MKKKLFLFLCVFMLVEESFGQLNLHMYGAGLYNSPFARMSSKESGGVANIYDPAWGFEAGFSLLLKQQNVVSGQVQLSFSSLPYRQEISNTRLGEQYLCLSVAPAFKIAKYYYVYSGPCAGFSLSNVNPLSEKIIFLWNLGLNRNLGSWGVGIKLFHNVIPFLKEPFLTDVTRNVYHRGAQVCISRNIWVKENKNKN